MAYKAHIQAHMGAMIELIAESDPLRTAMVATDNLVRIAKGMGGDANPALLALQALAAKQKAEIQKFDQEIDEIERALDYFVESCPELVTQAGQEILDAAPGPKLGAAPGPKLGAAPGSKLGAAPGSKLGAALVSEEDDDPQMVAAIQASLESKREADEAAYWDGFVGKIAVAAAPAEDVDPLRAVLRFEALACGGNPNQAAFKPP